jgi:hypothetical protein
LNSEHKLPKVQVKYAFSPCLATKPVPLEISLWTRLSWEGEGEKDSWEGEGEKDGEGGGEGKGREKEGEPVNIL